MIDQIPLSDYSTAAQFSHLFTQALIRVKKNALGFAGEQSPSREEALSSRAELAGLLQSVIANLNYRPDAEIMQEHWVRAAFSRRSEDQRAEDLLALTERLEQLIRKLNEEETALDPEDFALMDEIASAADLQASRAFHQFMRK